MLDQDVQLVLLPMPLIGKRLPPPLTVEHSVSLPHGRSRGTAGRPCKGRVGPNLRRKEECEYERVKLYGGYAGTITPIGWRFSYH